MTSKLRIPKVIIIGAGASGIAAACRLLENGWQDIIVLEAENRIGGRINSVKFGGSVVDLGAQWCHGEKGNIVYSLAKDLDLLGSSFNAYNDFTYYKSTGEHIKNDDKLLKILKIAYAVLHDEDDQNTGSVGENFINKYNKIIAHEFGNSDEVVFASEISDWFHKLVCCYNAAPTWFDLSASTNDSYKECDGDLYLHWKDKGFRAILDVLMKKIPNSGNHLAVEDKIFFNKEVCRIIWDNNVINRGGVTVECVDGSLYNADHVLVTLSLGVLKQNHRSLFNPELPLGKQNAIDGLGFGTVNKVFLEFTSAWWPSTCKGFSFIWSADDRGDVIGRFPEGPCRDGKSWLEDVLGFYTIDSHPRILMGWFVGSMVEDAESLTDETLLAACMYLLRRFVGSDYDVPEPIDMLRSSWYSNSHFSGSYSYRSVETDKTNVSNDDLAEPIVVDSKQVLLFSGEATHPHYYSTVHGAIETGFREADRLISIYSKTTVEQL